LKPSIEKALARGDLDAAEALCRSGLGGVENRFCLLTLARIAFVRGNAADALRWLRALRAAQPVASDWMRIGDLLQAMGRLGGADAAWRRAGLSEEVLRRRFLLLDESSRADEARDVLRQALAAFPDAQWALEEEASRLFAEGDLEAALRCYEALSGAFAAYACGEIRLRCGDLDAALQHYRSAVAQGSPLPWPHYRLASLALRAGKPEGALLWLKDAPFVDGLDEFRARVVGAAGRPRDADRLLASMLQKPTTWPLYEKRLADLKAGRCRLHTFKNRHHWTNARLRVVVYQCDGAAADVSALADLVRAVQLWFVRELGQSLPVTSWETRSGPHDYEFFRNAIAHEALRHLARTLEVRRRRDPEVLLVLWCGGRLARGYGGYGHAVLDCALGNAVLPTVLAHELLHATLALMHTDGSKDALEAGGIMGVPGASSLLEDTYVHFRQKAHCATLPAAQRLAGRAWRADEAGRWNEAAELYRAMLKHDPLHLWAASRLAQVEVHRGDYEAAVVVLRDLMILDPAAEHASQLAQVLLDMGQLAAARRALGQARGWRRMERTHVLAGFAYARAWRHVEAAREFRRALSLDADSLQAQVNLSCSLHSLGRFDAALAGFDRVLKRDPHWAEVYDRLAVLHAETGNLPLAKRMLRKAGSLKPDDAGHHFARARVACLDGRWDAAPAMLRKCLDEEPHTASAQCWLGYVLDMQGEESEINWFSRCEASERLSPWGRISSAWLAIDSGAHDTYASHWNTLTRLHERDSRVAPLVHALAYLARPLGRDPKPWVALLFSLEPKHPWLFWLEGLARFDHRTYDV
jgi:tetratricopeptide (TPR) repeat protein